MRGFQATLVMVLAASATSANAQWYVVRLGNWIYMSRAYGVSENGIVGFYAPDSQGLTGACLWRYDVEDQSWHWRNLHYQVTWSMAVAISATQTVGFGQGQTGGVHAYMWNDTADSWVDLNPEGASESLAFGVGGGVQVGAAYIYNSGRYKAGFWRGSAASWVNLGGMLDWSLALAGNADSQVGYAVATNVAHTHAALWYGTAASLVDLHPAIPYDSSEAYGVSGNEQVGMVAWGGQSHASLWHGTAESWVDLHPSTMTGSSAQGVFNGIQVGYTTYGSGPKRAALWRGSASTFEDLHAQLGPCFVESAARAVWQDEKYTYVVGYARDSGRPAEEAILWMLPATPFCAADLNRDGFVNGDDFDYFAVYFEAGHVSADFNGDCFVNGNDFDSFAEHFEAGC